LIRTLFLVRHAQAAESSEGEKDLDRELTSKGKMDARHLGKYLFKNLENPNIILSSKANRARETAEIIAEQLKFDDEMITLHSEMYDASIRILLEVVNSLNSEFESALLVGHNPAISYLCEYLTKSDFNHISAGGVVVLEFKDLAWKEVSEATGNLKVTFHPDEETNV